MSDRVKIQVKKNGSVRVTGTVDFVDAEGNVIESKTDFSLCRCGASKRSHFAMAVTVKLGLSQSNLVS